MGFEIEYIDGQTPLDEEEKEGLKIPSITTRAELDEFEQHNIEKAIEWTLSRKFKPEQILSEDFIRKLHFKMFGEVWKWAGEFRKTEKNLGITWKQISTSLKQLNDDCLFWIKDQTCSAEEIAIRYKHRIVQIHCFSNGNGRHSRLMGDVIISHIFSGKIFSWGEANSKKGGDARKVYLKVLKEADNGVLDGLIKFARK